MATTAAKPRAPQPDMSVVDWLLNSDPSIRWQTLQDLLHASADEVAAERARVATEGVGARLLSMQGTDGYLGWRGVEPRLELDHACLDVAAGNGSWTRRATRRVERSALVRDHVRWRGWDWDGRWHGLGLARQSLLRRRGRAVHQRAGGSERRLFWPGHRTDPGPSAAASSFPTAAGTARRRTDRRGLRSTPRSACWKPCSNTNWPAGTGPKSRRPRLRGEEFLLDRRLFRRRSTGAVIDFDRKVGPNAGRAAPAWTRFAFPTWWHYDVLRGLDYLRRAGVTPDDRVTEAVELVASKRAADGRWPLDVRYPGEMPVEMDEGEGRPSRWITLRALRVLDWYSSARRVEVR